MTYSSEFSVGDAIESRCTKCRKITNHIIVAIIGKSPAKVQCNTCGGQHKYRSPVVKKVLPAKSVTTPNVAEQREWQRLKDKIESKRPLEYTMEAAFKVDDVIRHPKFGLGIVQNSLGPQKIEVLFEDGRKIMRCR